MIYKIKTWKFIPVVSEVFISAKTDQECLKIFEDIKDFKGINTQFYHFYALLRRLVISSMIALVSA